VLRIQDIYPESRILIFIHPGFRIPDPESRIPDPTPIATIKKEEGEKLNVLPFFVSHKLHNMENYFISRYTKKFEPIDKDLKYLLL